MRRLAAFVPFALAGSLLGAAVAADAFRVPRLDGIAVDGDGADWGEAGLRLELLTPNRPQRLDLADLDARVALGWDARGLLVLARVTDDDLREASQRASLWSGDGMELFLAPGRGATDWVQYAVAPGVSEGYPQARWFLHDWRSPATRLPGEAAFAGRRTAAGYTLEGLVPWSPLGIESAAGRVVAFQFYVNDVDALLGGAAQPVGEALAGLVVPL